MAKYAISSGQPGKKRGLVATATIYSGESILEERPLICEQFLWNFEYKYAACEYCLTPLETAEENVRRLTGDSTITLPYTEQCCPTNKSTHVSCTCGTVQYCSADCRLQAWNLYHKTLCPAEPSNNPELGQAISKLCDFWKNIHYPPETASIMLLVKILASIRQSSNPLELISKFNEFTSFMGNVEEMLRRYLGEKFKEQIGIIRELVDGVLNPRHNFPAYLEQFFSDQGFSLLLCLIIRHGQAIGTNAFSQWAKNCERYVANNPLECGRISKLIEQLFEKMDETSGLQFINNEGSGLFPVSFLINHSCAANAEICFPHNNNVLEVKATMPIEAGEEITICYLDECMQSSSRHSRVKYLQENYSFTCRCNKCESQLDQPDVTSEEDDSSDGDDHSSGDEMNCD